MHLETSRSSDRTGYHEQERARECDDEDDAVLEREPIGGQHVPVLGHDSHDDLAWMLVRDDLAPMLVHGDHDDLALMPMCDGHRGHDHENLMVVQVPECDEGLERLHGDEGQEHRLARDGRSVL